jgi:atypical dual specificity phosphatase
VKKLSKEELFLKFGRYGIQPFDWIDDGRLMASVYPPGLEYLRYLRLIEGIGFCINLAEDPWPGDWPEKARVDYLHVPVMDMGIPSNEQVHQVIRAIDGNDGPVMVHCAAGLGRTGTMISLYLAEKGLNGDLAISQVRSKRPGSVQTTEQERMVIEWAERRRWRERTQ